VGESEREPENE